MYAGRYDNASSSAATSGPIFGGRGSTPTVTPNSASAAVHTGPTDATRVRETADKNYKRLKADSRHPSLRLKQIGKVWSVRVGERYRALGHDVPDGIKWYWIGSHAEYDKILGS